MFRRKTSGKKMRLRARDQKRRPRLEALESKRLMTGDAATAFEAEVVPAGMQTGDYYLLPVAEMNVTGEARENSALPDADMPGEEGGIVAPDLSGSLRDHEFADGRDAVFEQWQDRFPMEELGDRFEDIAGLGDVAISVDDALGRLGDEAMLGDALGGENNRSGVNIEDPFTGDYLSGGESNDDPGAAFGVSTDDLGAGVASDKPEKQVRDDSNGIGTEVTTRHTDGSQETVTTAVDEDPEHGSVYVSTERSYSNGDSTRDEYLYFNDGSWLHSHTDRSNGTTRTFIVVQEPNSLPSFYVRIGLSPPDGQPSPDSSDGGGWVPPGSRGGNEAAERFNLNNMPVHVLVGPDGATPEPKSTPKQVIEPQAPVINPDPEAGNPTNATPDLEEAPPSPASKAHVLPPTPGQF